MRATIVFLLALVALAIAKPVVDSASSRSFASEERSEALCPTSVAPPTAAAARAPQAHESRGAGDEKGQEVDLAELRSAEESDADGMDGEAMDGAETVAFRPLFVHRDRIARYGSKVRVRRQATRRQPPRQRTPPLRPFRKGRKPLQILY